jgi:hypothetical protein
MNTKPDDPRITAYLFDELAGVELAAFESELDASAELRELVDQSRQIIDQIKNEFATESDLQLADTQRATVGDAVALIEAGATAAGPGHRVRWRRLAVVAVLAASLAYVLALPALNNRLSRTKNVTLVDAQNAKQPNWLELKTQTRIKKRPLPRNLLLSVRAKSFGRTSQFAETSGGMPRSPWNLLRRLRNSIANSGLKIQN